MRRILVVPIIGIVSASLLLGISEINLLAQPVSALTCIHLKSGTVACGGGGGAFVGTGGGRNLAAISGPSILTICGNKPLVATPSTGNFCGP